MNYSFKFLSINYYLNSPFFISTNLDKSLIIKNFNFKKSFNLFHFNLNNIFSIIKNSKFQNFLTLVIHINSQNYIETNFSFNSIPINIIGNYSIIDCIFFKCISSTSTAGILIHNSETSLNIIRTGFFEMSNSKPASSGGSSLYSKNAYQINFYEVCFINCQSNHGASYGIHSYYNVMPIQYVNINNTLESLVGYNNRISTHSSYSGGLIDYKFYFNNISKCITSPCGIYILHVPSLFSIVKYCQVENGIGSYIFRFNMYYSNNLFEFSNFINNSISQYYIQRDTVTYIFNSSLFINNSNNIPISSNIGNFFYCNFSNVDSTIFKGSSIFNNCIFNLNTNINRFFFEFNSKKCWALGSFKQISKNKFDMNNWKLVFFNFSINLIFLIIFN